MPRAPAQPTRFDRMHSAAEKGDIDGIIAALDESPMPCADQVAFMRELRAGLDKLAADDPQKLVEYTFSKMLSFQAFLLLRAQRFADDAIRECDRSHPRIGDLPESVVTEWMPRISRLQTEVRETARSLAALQHTFALARHGPGQRVGPHARVIQLHDQAGAGGQREAAGGR